MNDNKPYSYLDAGYNEFLVRKRNEPQEMTQDDASILVQRIPSYVTTYGKSSSDHMDIDWDKGEIVIYSDSRKRVVFGKVEETGQYGIKVYEADGSVGFSELYT